MKRVNFLLFFIVALLTFNSLPIYSEPLAGDGDELEFINEDDGFVWYSIYKGDMAGAKDAQKNIIIPYSRNYTAIYYRTTDKYFKVMRGDKVGICNKRGQEIIAPTKYTSVWSAGDRSCFEVYIDKKQGLCSLFGKEFIEPKYPAIYLFSEGNFIIVQGPSNDEYYSVYDYYGKQIISESDEFTSVQVKNNLLWCAKKYQSDKRTYNDAGELVAYDWVTNNKKANTNQGGMSSAELATAFLLGMTDGFNSSYPSYGNNSSSYGSSNSSQGGLVGNFQAFGLSSSYGSTSTHRQTFSVYRDSRGYYIIEPRWKNKQYLNVNSHRSYYNYPVGDYNYTTMTSQGTDIFWFFRL